jgi:hypothetical protein
MSAALPFLRFQRDVLRRPLSIGQQVLASVAVDGVDPIELETEAEREMAHRILGPVDRIPESARGVLVVVGGRAWGKTRFLGDYLLWRGLTADVSSLAPGEMLFGPIVAPDVDTGGQALRFALGAAEATPAIASLIESKTTSGFVLRRPDGVRYSQEVFAASRGGANVRGRSLAAGGMDEASFLRDPKTGQVNDVGNFTAMAPRVLPGGLVVLATTPWIEGVGLAATEYAANFGNPTTAIAVHAPTLLMLDSAQNRAMVERERRRDPDNAAREFDAVFLTGGAGVFFGPELLGPALDDGLSPRESAEPGYRVAIGGDLGLVTDCSAFVAVHRAGDQIVVADMLEMAPSKGKPLKLSEVVRAGCAFAARHGQRVIAVDHHALEPAREHLPEGFKLVPVEGGQAPKVERFLCVRDTLRESRLHIPGAFSALVSQLGDVVAKPTAGGGLSITIPRRSGSHGDTAAAAVLAIWKVSQDDARHANAYTDARRMWLRATGFVGDGKFHDYAPPDRGGRRGDRI